MQLQNKLKYILNCLLLYLILVNLFGCSKESSILEKIKSNGTLRVGLIANPPHYLPNKIQKRGYDFELVSNYAELIDVKLEITKSDNVENIIYLLGKDKVDIAVIGSSPEFNINNIQHAATYNNSHWQIIGNRSNKKLPKFLNEIKPKTMIIESGGKSSLILRKSKEAYPTLNWNELKNTNVRDVLEIINQEKYKLTIINSEMYNYYQYLFPETKIALMLPNKYPSRWLIKKSNDLSFLYSIKSFFKKYKLNGELKRIHKTYFDHLNTFDYVDIRYYLKRINKKLPKYKDYFIEASKNSILDASIIAAVSYQESHWNRKARSPTGVRGMMMLTLDTAKQVGVKSRLNAKQSIIGGAKYLEILYKSFNIDIQEPERLWFTLAAYNIGLGHIIDAQKITELEGDNPNNWNDVKKHLPKLSQKKWYKKTKHGFARGHEPIEFVRRVRRYYDILCLYQQKGLL